MAPASDKPDKAELQRKGFARYKGAVHGSVYEYFQCPRPGKARWYHKDGVFCCVGCSLACETDDKEGFQSFLLP